MSTSPREVTDFPPIRYSQQSDPFFSTLRQRVDAYFRDSNRSRFADWRMVGKTLAQLSLWVGLYAMILSNGFSGWPLILLVVGWHFTMFLMSVGIAHDGSHNAYSSRPWVNKWMTWVFDFIGINSYMWDFNHIQSHHRAPNVPVYDAAIYSFHLFRLHPKAPYQPIHRYQHWYIFLIYGFSTLYKLFFHDFFSFLRDRIGTIPMKRHSTREVLWLLTTKLVVIGYSLVIPLLIVEAPVWQLITGFLIGHFLSGIALGVIFMVTHVADHSAWPEPDEQGRIDNTFARHIMATTSDFCAQNPTVTWIAGGLNIHVAHHLFPGVCQIHLPALARIVRETSEEFGVDYNEYPTVWAAVRSHLKTLKQLGTDRAFRGKVAPSENPIAHPTSYATM